jgi:ComEC/Rec2-related protein
MRRPLVGVAIVLWVGVLVGTRVTLPLGLLWVLGGISLIAGWWLSRGGAIRAGACVVLIGACCTGAISGALHRMLDMRLMAQVGEPLQLPGVVVSGVQPARGRLCFDLRTLRYGVVPVEVAGRLRRWPKYGDRFSIVGELGLDWRERPVLRTHRKGLVRTGGSALGVFAVGCRWRDAIGRQLVAGVDGPPAAEAAVQAMVLGYRERIDRETRAVFAATGTSHVFALSGLHVAYLCAVVYFLVACVGVPRRWWWLALLPFVVGYVVVTGARASAVRAGIMVVALALAPALGRQPDAPSAVALAVVGLALFAPGQLLEVGAIYSFAVVAGIMVLYPALCRVIRVPSLRDGLAREEMQPTRSTLDRCIRFWVDIARVSVAAWLVSLPLSAHYFGRISLVAPLANLVVIPLVGLMLTSAVLSLVAVPLAGWVAVTLNTATVGLATVLVTLSRWFAAIPYASLEVRPWSWPLVWGWLLLLVIIGVAAHRPDGPEAGSHAYDETS